ncbi:MAG: hypothetical protein JXB45_06755 [Candidatus Krumholzibacteriota bacterium]|nr:hypothetical protein [Candidatus Krumholzibacteriota bacterium]
MPRTSINLRDRRVIISGLVILGALLVVNWRILGPLRAERARLSPVRENQPPIPSDLREMQTYASLQMDRNRSGSGLIKTAAAVGPSKFTDPFGVIPALDTLREGAGEEYYGFMCSAVLLGGDRPTALINGKSLHPGEWIGGFLVERISERGVDLSAGRKRIFLPVTRPAVGKQYFPPVTGR